MIWYFLVLIFLTACNSNDSATPVVDTGIVITASVSDFDNAIPGAIPSLFKNPKIKATTDGTESTQVNITPYSYKLALVNFWLMSEAGDEVNILNPDETTPNCTTERPCVMDFSSSDDLIEIFSPDTIPAGTYTGYKMQFVYIEMLLPCAFHVPVNSWETEIDNLGDILDVGLYRNFRLYYNTSGKYCKRDFVVELVPDSGQWYWMRRSVTSSEGYQNFFISVDDNDHLPGGAGFESLLDLFSNPDFWGDEDTTSLCETDPIIYMSTESTTGDVLAEINGGSIEIPTEITDIFQININVNIENTMNYNEGTTPYTGTDYNAPTFTAGILDLGPDFSEAGEAKWGDQGLHPFPPGFEITTSTVTEAPATTTSTYQIPQDCIDAGYTEPATCYSYYCTDHADDDFCITYQ